VIVTAWRWHREWRGKKKHSPALQGRALPEPDVCRDNSMPSSRL
jgi:hypothetical protein